MFLDDIDPKDFTRYKAQPQYWLARFGKKVEQYRMRKLAQINADVHVRDLILTTIRPGHGEVGTSPSNNRGYDMYLKATYDRLLAHIKTIFSFANEEHRGQNCVALGQGKFQIKPDKVNYVTRLCMHEFSLYTHEPLSIEEYTHLCVTIEKMAEQLEPNVHILLSSFAIKNNSGKLFNTVLFVEGGQPPILHSFCKNTSSLADVNYENAYQLFSQQNVAAEPSIASEYVAGEQLVSTESVFEVTTLGGACYTQMIDICQDHINAHSKRIMERRIQENGNPDELLPEQIEHIVTSSTTGPNFANSLSSGIVHADSNPHDYMLKGYRTLGATTLDEATLKRIIDPDYPNMSIITHDQRYEIQNPPFGPPYTIDILKDRPAFKYEDEFQALIRVHNQRVIKRKAELTKGLILKTSDLFFHYIEKNNLIDSILIDLEELEKQLLKECRYEFFEEWLGTGSYEDKKQANKHITEMMLLMKTAIKNDKIDSIMVVKDTVNRLHLQLSCLGTAGYGWMNRRMMKHFEDFSDRFRRDIEKEFPEFSASVLRTNH